MFVYYCFFFQGETGNKRKKNRHGQTTAKKSKIKGGIKQNQKLKCNMQDIIQQQTLWKMNSN